MFNAEPSAVLLKVSAQPTASEGEPRVSTPPAPRSPRRRPGPDYRGYRGSGLNLGSWILIALALLLAPLSELTAEFFVEAADRLDR